MDNIIDIGLYLSYALVIFAILAAVILPLINSFGDPKKLVKMGVGLGALVIVFFVAYTISSSEVTAVYLRNNVDEGASQLIGGALITMYMFFVVAFVSIIFTEVAKLFK